MRLIIRASFIIFILMPLPSLSFADNVDYLYDGNGRLVRVSNPDNIRILYQYDEVGNLMSIIKETSIPQALPPSLQGIDPDILLTGETYNVIITGQNLLTTSSVTSDNPGITIKSIAAIDTKIIAVFSIADTAATGTASITVTTAYGSASRDINLHGINLSPQSVLSFPSRLISFSASLDPAATSDITVKVNNENADIIDTTPTITIPAGGNINFDATTLRPGRGVIKIGSEKAIVEVIDDYYEALPVSVALDTLSTGDASVSSDSVSVEITVSPFELITKESIPVSVKIESSDADIATINSIPVSVNVGGSFDVATSMSAPVSVLISSGSADTATFESLPVSVNVGGIIDAVTSESAPVSVLISSSSIDITTSESGAVSVVIEKPDEESVISANNVSVIIALNPSDSVTAGSVPVSVVINGDPSVSATVNPLPISVSIQSPQFVDAMSVSQLVAVGWCSDLPVKDIGSTTTYYSTLQDAYNAASDGDTIQSQFGEFSGNVNINLDKSITVEGGYDCGYTSITGQTSLKGTLTISNGTIIIKNLILKE